MSRLLDLSASQYFLDICKTKIKTKNITNNCCEHQVTQYNLTISHKSDMDQEHSNNICFLSLFSFSFFWCVFLNMFKCCRKQNSIKWTQDPLKLKNELFWHSGYSHCNFLWKLCHVPRVKQMFSWPHLHSWENHCLFAHLFSSKRSKPRSKLLASRL